MSYPTSKQLKERRLWKAEQSFCWWCGKPGEIDVHEIIPKSATGQWAHRANYFSCCRNCHRGIQLLSHEMTALVLAIKERRDPDRFDLAVIKEILGRGEYIEPSRVQFFGLPLVSSNQL